MAKQQSKLVGALAKVPTGKLPGRVYAGGTPYFDERTGKRTVPPQSPQMGPPLTQAPQMQRVSPGVYRNPQGQLIQQQQQPQRAPGADQRYILDAVSGAGSALNNVFGPKGQAPLNMQKPFMNQQPPAQQAPGRMAPQQQKLDLSQISNMSGEEIQQYISQLQQAQQAQQMQPAPQFNPSMYQDRQGT